MKKLFSILAILMVAMTAWAQIYMPTGDGTSDSPYKISRAEELLWFVDQVNQNRQGNTAICGELTQDIDMTGFSNKFEPIGYWDAPYTGSFNGNGHRIKNLNYTGAAGKEVGFFGVVAGENTTIKGLIIDSSCSFTTNSAQQAYGAAGIVACLKLDGEQIHFTLSGCGNEATINGDLMVAGLVGGLLNAEESTADKCSITIENCYNTGAIKGREGETQTAALIAYGIQKLNVKRCYNTGTVTNCTEGRSLIRYNVNSTVGLDDDMRYNLSTVASDYNAKSVTAEEFANGSICYLLNGSKSTGTLAWYQTIGIDASPVVERTHGTVYFTGTDYCPVNTYSNAETAHTPNTVDGISTCSVCQHISYQEPGQDASGNYLLGNKGNLLWFAGKVNAGSTSINAKLIADIDLGDDQTKIGWNRNPYQGTFDGDGNTITVHYVATEDYTALFNNVKGATIKNLRTAGSITTGYKFAAGIVALCSSNERIHTHITNCISSVTITSTFSEAKDGSHGGIVADNQWEVYLTNVVFNGKLLGENATNCGGLVGCAKYDVYASNCLFCPSEVTFSSSEAKTLARAGKVHLHVSNSYYVTALGDAQGTQVTAEQVCLGDVCNKLNSGNSSTVWSQNLETDAYPTFGTAGVHYARTMTNEWGTVVLPYDVTYSQSNGNYKLYKLSEADDQDLTFTEYENGTIAAGTPMAVMKLTGEGIDIAPASTPNFSTDIHPVSVVTDWTMTGTYSNLTDQTGIYFIANNQFWWAESPITIAPFRAWFTGPAPTNSGAPLRIVEGDGSETSTIAEITTDGSVNFFDAPIYNLQGQRLSAPQKGQINIINGKKVSIK